VWTRSYNGEIKIILEFQWEKFSEDVYLECQGYRNEY